MILTHICRYIILFEGVCGSKRTVLMTRACNQVRTPSPCTHFVGRPRPPGCPIPPCQELKCRIFAKKISLGPHSECNVKKKVAYVLCFRDPKSLRPHSGGHRFSKSAYLIALLAPRNSTLQYLIALLQPRNSKVL